jgi:spermidine synthase
MAWELIETAQVAEGELTLYRQGEVFMIRANGYELMNGLGHQSELALGRMAVEVARPAEPHILIGGLGLGYTLAATAAALAGRGRITVAELSPQVIAWFDRFLAGTVLPQRPDNLSIMPGDIGALILREDVGPFDVIVLDVDNGPEALVSPRNAVLYSADGLRAFASKLSADGIILLWSAFEAPEFVSRAEEAGFSVSVRSLAAVRRPDLLHYAYLLESRARPVCTPSTLALRDVGST